MFMSNKEFKIIFFGYAPKEVDVYIETLNQKTVQLKEIILEKDSIINTLQKEIKNYCEKEENITKVMMRAQSSADDIVKEGKRKAQQIQEELIQQSNNISTSLEETKKQMKLFYEEYQKLLRKYLTPIQEDDMAPIFNNLDKVKATLYVIQEDLKNKTLYKEQNSKKVNIE